MVHSLNVLTKDEEACYRKRALSLEHYAFDFYDGLRSGKRKRVDKFLVDNVILQIV